MDMSAFEWSGGELDNAFAATSQWLAELADGGPDLRVNAHKKAAHEAKEFAETPTLEEAADVFICLTGALAHRGYTREEFSAAIFGKLIVNRSRTWVQQDDGTWQHS